MEPAGPPLRSILRWATGFACGGGELVIVALAVVAIVYILAVNRASLLVVLNFVQDHEF